MNLRDLETERDEIEHRLITIKQQVQLAKGRAGATGDYSDHDWYARATAAIRILGSKHQKVLRDIAAIRKEERAREHELHESTLEARFVKVAKEALDPDVYRRLMDRARAEREAANVNRRGELA